MNVLGDMLSGFKVGVVTERCALTVKPFAPTHQIIQEGGGVKE